MLTNKHRLLYEFGFYHTKAFSDFIHTFPSSAMLRWHSVLLEIQIELLLGAINFPRCTELHYAHDSGIQRPVGDKVQHGWWRDLTFVERVLFLVRQCVMRVSFY